MNDLTILYDKLNDGNKLMMSTVIRAVLSDLTIYLQFIYL